MKTYSDFKVGSEGFIKDLRVNVEAAHADMVGACTVSTDPKVRGALERWLAFQDILGFHVNSGKKETPR